MTRVLSKRHQVRQQKAIRRMNLVLVILGLRQLPRADRMTGKRQRHVLSAPIIPAAAPFLRPGALGLRRLAVVKEKSRIAFQRVKIIAVRKNKRRADEASRPIAAAFGLARVEQHHVLVPAPAADDPDTSRENNRRDSADL